MDEEEIRKCEVCSKIMDYCHARGKANQCAELLVKVKKDSMNEEEFVNEMKKILGDAI